LLEQIKEFIAGSDYFDGFFENPYYLNEYLKIYLLELMIVYLWHAAIHKQPGLPAKDNVDLLLRVAFGVYTEINSNGT
jgi:hypothetical protein